MSDISAKLRTLRRARGWSLLDVERVSQGRIKAVVLGSYERGSRTLSVKRAIEIADLYEIPLSQLFTDKKFTTDVNTGRKMFDLRIISNRAQVPNEYSERFTILARYTRSIVESRGDWNGEVLSLRSSDCTVLALILNIEITALMQWLDDQRVLLTVR
jgi:transcriptional regulator with XRE-family HTH domain